MTKNIKIKIKTTNNIPIFVSVDTCYCMSLFKSEPLEELLEELLEVLLVKLKL
jgi:hypothetical protein